MDSDLETTALFSRNLKNERTSSLTSSETSHFKPSSASYGSTFAKSIQKVTPLTISWHNLTVKKNDDSSVLILDNVCGIAKAGQFVALMGSRFA